MWSSPEQVRREDAQITQDDHVLDDLVALSSLAVNHRLLPGGSI
jgi:hypothetical protein